MKIKSEKLSNILKKHFIRHWIIYFYFILQTLIAILYIKDIINWKFIYIILPSIIIITLLIMTIFLGYICGIKDQYPFDRNSDNYK